MWFVLCYVLSKGSPKMRKHIHCGFNKMHEKETPTCKSITSLTPDILIYAYRKDQGHDAYVIS